jgi:hypothetical protein
MAFDFDSVQNNKFVRSIVKGAREPHSATLKMEASLSCETSELILHGVRARRSLSDRYIICQQNFKLGILFVDYHVTTARAKG